MEPRKITVLGDGAMASVCAMALDALGHRVTMWGPFGDYVETLRKTGRNERYLPGFAMPKGVRFTAEEGEAAREASLIVCAIPTQFIRPVCGRFKGQVEARTPVVSVSKGVECGTLLRPTQVILEALGGEARPVAALSGPSIAEELARQLPATLCAASEELRFADELQGLFTTKWLRIYTNRDLIGVELAGATKNVIALAAGILDGLEAGYNAKSALLARGLSEIARLGVAMGASAETFFGITGVGDLATTCFHPHGRNRSCGERLGRGMSLEAAQGEIKGVVEGVATTRSVMELARRQGVEMPITAAVHGVLFEGLDAREAVAQLMSRSPKRERVG